MWGWESSRKHDTHPPTADSVHLIRAQVDNGAQTTTTDQRHLIHEFRSLTSPRHLLDAGENKHHCQGEGYLKVPTLDKHKQPTFSLIHTWFTPSLPQTIISPGEIKRRHPSRFQGSNILSLDDLGKGCLTMLGKRHWRDNLYIPLLAKDRLTYSEPLVLPTPSEAQEPFQVHKLSVPALKALWHQRLCHLHRHDIASLHQHVDGVPHMQAFSDIENCPTCMMCKMQKTARGTGDTRRHAQEVGQGISLDWGFMVQTSKDSKRVKKLTGIHGESAYLLITDHFSGKMWGYTSSSKNPPLKWINRWLTRYSSKSRNRYACMDLGGELGRHPDVRALLGQHGYSIHTTGPDASHQNGVGERPHQTIANVIRSLLTGANLDPIFWPYAFHHALFVHGLLPQGDKGVPHTRATGERPDLSKLRTFGCRVYVRPPGKRRSKLDNHVNKGIFLGHTSTMTQAIYWDLDTKKVKTATHVKYDEGMNDLDHPTPNSHQLRQALGHPLPPESTEETSPTSLSFESSESPFQELWDTSIPIKCTGDTLGFDISHCPARGRGYLTHAAPHSTASGLKNWKKRLKGAYIISVDDTPVFTKEDIEAALRHARHNASFQEKPSLKLTFAPDRHADNFTEKGTPDFLLEQFRPVVRSLYEMGEGKTLTPDDEEELWLYFIHAVHETTGISSQSSHTRRQLQKEPEWDEWLKAEHKQLDDMGN